MNRFGEFFRRHAFVSSACLYGCLYGVGDQARQTIQQVPSRDYTNSARMAAVGGGVLAPIFFGWYKILDSAVKGQTWKIVITKTVLDQLIAGSASIVLFYTGMSVLERKEDVFAELRQKGVKTYMTGCIFWPSVQIFNFRFAPPHARTAFVATAAFVWCVILSFFKSAKKEDSETGSAE